MSEKDKEIVPLGIIQERTGADIPLVWQQDNGPPVQVPVSEANPEKLVSEEYGKKYREQRTEYDTQPEAWRWWEGIASGNPIHKAQMGLGASALDAVGVTHGLADDYKKNALANERFGDGAPEALGFAASMLMPVGEVGLAAKAGLGSLAAKMGIAEAEKLAVAGVEAGAAKYLGNAAKTVLEASARTGIEGALYSAGAQVSQNVIHDRPLTAEVLASAGGGLMLGAIGGGVASGIGQLGSAALGGAMNRISAKADEAVARRMGIASEKLPTFLSGASKELEMAGASGLFTKEALISATAKNEKTFAAMKRTALDEFVANAPPAKVDVERMMGEVRKLGDEELRSLVSVAKKSKAGANGYLTLQEANRLSDLIGKDATLTAASKDSLQNVIVNEMRITAETASLSPSTKALWKKYEGASLGEATSREIREIVSHAKAEPMATPGNAVGEAFRDAGIGAAIGLATGHPVAGVIAFGARRLATKAINSHDIAETVHRLSASGQWAKATETVQNIVTSTVREFVRGGVRAKGLATVSGGMKDYEAAKAGVERSASPEFADMVRRYAERVSSSKQMQDSIIKVHQRATSEMLKRMQAAEPFSAPSLLAKPKGKQRVLTQEQAAFMRGYSVVSDPMSAMKNILAGRMTRDDAKLFRSQWPALHGEMVNSLRAEVAMMQQSGGGLTPEKVVMLSDAVGESVSPLTDPAFIRGLQSSFAVVAEQRAKAAEGAPQQEEVAPATASPLLTAEQRGSFQ